MKWIGSPYSSRARNASAALPCLSVLLAVTSLVAGCSNSPTNEQFLDRPGFVLAVSVPESLVAGDSTTVYVHVGGYSCADRFLGFAPVGFGVGGFAIQPVMRTPVQGVCLLDAGAGPFVFPYRVLVPLSGTRTLRCKGADDEVAVALTAGIGATHPEHRLQLLPRASTTPVDSLEIDYFAGGSYGPGESLGVAVTDRAGMAVATPNPPRYPDETWYLYWRTSYGQLIWLAEFGSALDPTRRAMRTLVPFGPRPGNYLPASAWHPKEALYVSGNAWNVIDRP